MIHIVVFVILCLVNEIRGFRVRKLAFKDPQFNSRIYSVYYTQMMNCVCAITAHQLKARTRKNEFC